VIEERCEIFWHFITLLETRSKSICKRSNIRYVLILIDLGFIINITLELSIFVLIQKPFENRFLDLLVVFVFEEFVGEEFD